MSLPKLPSIRELIKLYGLSARSQLSQNFILDKNITGWVDSHTHTVCIQLIVLSLDKIVRTAHISAKTPLVVEVGPGPGLLSRSILDGGASRVIAVEKDDRFIPTLNVSENPTCRWIYLTKGLFYSSSNYQRLPNIDLMYVKRKLYIASPYTDLFYLINIGHSRQYADH
jgi:dimethyladenosine transferase 1